VHIKSLHIIIIIIIISCLLSDERERVCERHNVGDLKRDPQRLSSVHVSRSKQVRTRLSYRLGYRTTSLRRRRSLTPQLSSRFVSLHRTFDHPRSGVLYNISRVCLRYNNFRKPLFREFIFAHPVSEKNTD